MSFAQFPDPLLLRFPLGLEARGDAGLEGVAEVPPQAQRRVVLKQPRVDARGAAGGEVGSLAERATAAAAAAAGPPRRHHLAAIRRAAVANSWLPGARWRRRRGRGRGKPFACVGKGMRGGEERES